jgi:hypothetical protein
VCALKQKGIKRTVKKPTQALQQTGHAIEVCARHDVFSRVSLLLSCVVRVRHEVACASAMRWRSQRYGLLFRQQSPTRTCVSGNGEVGSSGDNVASSLGMAVTTPVNTTTASLNAVGNQERGHGELMVKRR